MVRWARRTAGLVVVLALFGAVIVGIKTQTAYAEGANQFPGITGAGTDWTFNNVSPDPNLTWQFKNSGANQVLNGNTTHILRTRSIGRNKGTRLRVYFAQRPVQVSVNINVINCDLDAPHAWGGPVIVRLGGQVVYNQDTDAWTKPTHMYEKKEYLAPNTRRVTTYGPAPAGDGGKYANSPVCQNYPSASLPLWVDRENCNNPGPNGTCTGSGNGTFTLDKNNGNLTYNPPNTALDGRTFTVNFPATGNGNADIGLDSSTGLWFADLDIDLDSRGDDALPPPDVMQRITFKVNAQNATSRANGTSMRARMGYRFFTDETQASKYFGLEGNGGRNNEFPGYGQKFAIPFGRDCSSTAPVQPGRIMVYDPDVAGYGPSYAIVFRRNPSNGNIVRLGKTDYNLINNVKWDTAGTNDRIELTAGSNQNSVFEVKALEPGFNYMLAIVNPQTKLPPSPNVWSLRLPTDSINGLVNCRYDLVPHLNSVQPAFSAYGDTLTPHGWITNSENSTSAGEHEWRITRAIFSSRPADLSRTTVMNTNDGEAICGFIQRRSGAPSGCRDIYRGTYPADSDRTVNDTLGTYAAGTYVCYITSVQNPTWQQNDNNQWANSPMQCSVAGVKPKLRVTGFDVKAVGSINTSLSGQAGNAFGSWGEYGVFSNGTNTGMASGSGLLGGGPNSQFFWSALTFANNGLYGGWGGVMPPSLNPGAGVPVGNVLGATTFGEGDKRVLRYNGTLYITGNLIYDNDGADNNGYNSIKGIPEIKIVADNIIIAPTVTQIDPWLIALSSTGTYGSLSTCGTSPGVPTPGVNGFRPFSTTGLLTTGLCQSQLKVNGPVTTDQLYAYRTSDSAGDAWAENFDLRASNFLSAYAGINTDRPVARTELITELPPRF